MEPQAKLGKIKETTMVAIIYPMRGKLDALRKRIIELGAGLAVRAVSNSIGGMRLECVCDEEQASEIEGMPDCDLLGRGDEDSS